MAKGAAKSAAKSATNSRVAMTAGKAFIRAERERNKRRIPLSKIPAEAREMFRCERWACSLSRWTCGLRWLEASKQDADAGLFRCANCPTGQKNADIARGRHQ